MRYVKHCFIYSLITCVSVPISPQILSSCEIPIRKLDGSLVESLPVLMDAVEYYVLIQDDGDGGHALTIEGAVERVRERGWGGMG